MGTPFKMKGSPMYRNFGIGSPMRDEEKPDQVIQAIMDTPENERSDSDKKVLSKYKAKQYQKKKKKK